MTKIERIESDQKEITRFISTSMKIMFFLQEHGNEIQFSEFSGILGGCGYKVVENNISVGIESLLRILRDWSRTTMAYEDIKRSVDDEREFLKDINAYDTEWFSDKDRKEIRKFIEKMYERDGMGE